MKKSWRFYTALLGALSLASCVTAPPGLEKDEFTLHSLSQIQPEDYACRCKQVRFGGKVLKATALKNQTKVEIMSLSVAALSAKPVLDSVAQGRFIAYLDGFVDPQSLQDQYITVKGKLTAQQQGKIDQADYVYPVVQVSAFKQWRLVQEYYYDYDDWDDYRYGLMSPRMRAWLAPPKLRYVLY